MYEQKFNFSQRPFSVCPKTEEYFPAQSHQQAISASRSCVERRNGPATIIGAVGTGKSLTLQVIGEVFAEQFDVVSIECSRLEQRSELLQSILFGMDLPFRDMSEGELRLSLIDHLKNGNGNANGILLLVDEADRLSIELLDELRLITNVVRDGLSQTQLVLAGTQRLEESLNDPRLASFGQRVASRSYLQSFSREEVGDYIAENIERAGGDVKEIFENEAIDEIARSSDGCPRVINQLCERSLAAAASQDRTQVTQAIVQCAWAELQNLPVPSPTPCSDDPMGDGANAKDSVIEFGSLDDEVPQCDAADADFQSAETDATQGEQNFTPTPSQTQSYEDADQSQPASAVTEAEAQADVLEPQDDADLEYVGQQSADTENRDEEAAENDIGYTSSTEVPSGFSGQLPTDLGLSDFGAYSAGAAGFTAANFGSGDPFAPEQESPSFQQGQYESAGASEPQPVSEFSSLQSNSAWDDQDAVEDAAEESSYGEVADKTENRFDHSFEQDHDEQIKADSFDETADQTESVEDPGDRGDELEASSNEENTDEDVRAAFDGLGLIDQARSSEGRADFDRQPVLPAADPFTEDFEEEVLLQDAYSPFVAQQNKSSLSVTSEHLSHLQPNDEVAAADEEPQGSMSDENQDGNLESPAEFHSQPTETLATYIPVQSVSTELRFPEPPQPLESPQQIESNVADEEIDPDLAALTSDFSFDEPTSSVTEGVEADNFQAMPDESDQIEGAQLEEGIRGQTFDMANTVREAIVSDHSTNSDDPYSQPPANTEDPRELNGEQDSSQSFPTSETQAIQYPTQPPLDKSQQVLREILAQQKIVNESQFVQPQSSDESVDSISVEYPITDHENYQAPSGSTNDDRDMLRVNESHYTQTPQQEPDEPTPFADAEPSTGEAQRMDYSQLFDQLRNMPKK